MIIVINNLVCGLLCRWEQNEQFNQTINITFVYKHLITAKSLKKKKVLDI